MTANIGLCAIAKDEGLYVEEWINYHLNIGFRHITIYDNASSDDTATIAGKYKDIDVIDWQTAATISPQLAAYNNFLDKSHGLYDWVMFLDLDEFLNLKLDKDVQCFVDRFPFADGVAINWRIFGSSGLVSNSFKPVLTRFKKASPKSFGPNIQVKTIFRPSKILEAGVHSPTFIEGSTLVDATGHLLTGNQPNVFVTDVNYEIAQINHYFIKSFEEFEKKRGRGRADTAADDPARFRKLEEFQLYDQNDEVDDTILRLC